MKINKLKDEILREMKNQILKNINEQNDSERSIVPPFPGQDVSLDFGEKTGAETPASKKGTEKFQQRMQQRDDSLGKEAAKEAMKRISDNLGKAFMDIKDDTRFRQFVVERVRTNAQKMGIQPTMEDIIDQTTISLNTLLFSLFRDKTQEELSLIIKKALSSK